MEYKNCIVFNKTVNFLEKKKMFKTSLQSPSRSTQGAKRYSKREENENALTWVLP